MTGQMGQGRRDRLLTRQTGQMGQGRRDRLLTGQTGHSRRDRLLTMQTGIKIVKMNFKFEEAIVFSSHSL